MNFGNVAAIIGIASTLVGFCVSLVVIGIKVGQLMSKVDDLKDDNEKFGNNNREKFNKVECLNNEQNQSIALLKQSLDSLHNDVKDIKDTLNSINAYIRESERFRAGIEARVSSLERGMSPNS